MYIQNMRFQWRSQRYARTHVRNINLKNEKNKNAKNAIKVENFYEGG